MAFLHKLIFKKMKILWNCMVENGADSYVNECQKLIECRVSLAEGKKDSLRIVDF